MDHTFIISASGYVTFGAHRFIFCRSFRKVPLTSAQTPEGSIYSSTMKLQLCAAIALLSFLVGGKVGELGTFGIFEFFQ